MSQNFEGKATTYLQIKNWKNHYLQLKYHKVVHFFSGLVINMILNFSQEWNFLGILIKKYLPLSIREVTKQFA